MSDGDPGGIAHLEKLAAELNGCKYAVTLLTREGRRPCLQVANQQATVLNEYIYAAPPMMTPGGTGSDGPKESRQPLTSKRRHGRSSGCCVPWIPDDEGIASCATILRAALPGYGVWWDPFTLKWIVADTPAGLRRWLETQHHFGWKRMPPSKRTTSAFM